MIRNSNEKTLIINSNRRIILFSILPFTVLLKFFQFRFLPVKFFYDSNHILNIMQSEDLHFALSGSYNNSALLFNAINIFNFNSLLQWSIFISILADIYLFFYLSDKKIYQLRQIISLYCMLGLLNIYVFNLSKDIIQFTIFAIIGAVIKTSHKKQVKIVLISLIFFAEGILFRSYYMLTALFFIAISVIIPFIITNKKTTASKKYFFLAALLFAALLIFLYVSRILFPDEYNELIMIRNRLTAGRVGSSDAQTLIVNLIADNGNHFLFVINYFINAVRIMLPIELLPKGLYYFPFFIFQILCTVSLLKCIAKFNKLSENARLAFYIMCAYYLVAFLFEPDFGSFVRHEAATFSVLYFAMIEKKRVENNDTQNNSLSLTK